MWANGVKTYRDYDLDGRLTTWDFRNGTSILRRDQLFDDANRVLAVSDPISPSKSQSYQYDSLSRLITAQTGSPVTHVEHYGYDSNGNRVTNVTDGSSQYLSVGGASNRLQALSTAPSAYLAGANTVIFTYSNANRLVSAQVDSAVATYVVNGLGQRTSKTVGGQTTRFMYDETGRLLGEYDATGKVIQETVWLDSFPVLTLRPNGTGFPTPVTSYYVHADHLGAPRAVTRPADNTVVWRWDNLDPFGKNGANDNPSGLGPFKYSLRFPGQYLDAETGMHYNYFRDYDPAIGRYLQSDPIGLDGGLNTYAYVDGDPLSRSDELGLKSVWEIVGVGAIAACNRIASCRARLSELIEQAKKFCKDVKCNFKKMPPDHRFPNGLYCAHYELNCYIEGVRHSGFHLQFALPGTCRDTRLDHWPQ